VSISQIIFFGKKMSTDDNTVNISVVVIATIVIYLSIAAIIILFRRLPPYPLVCQVFLPCKPHVINCGGLKEEMIPLKQIVFESLFWPMTTPYLCLMRGYRNCIEPPCCCYGLSVNGHVDEQVVMVVTDLENDMK